MTTPTIAVFRGGVSREREVSLGSGAAALAALSRTCTVRDYDVTAAALPAGFDPRTEVVFSTLHGTFGEDGGMQALLEQAGAAFCGCDSAASALCFDKHATKLRVAAAGVPVPRGLEFGAASRPTAREVISALGADVVLKPRAEGSSVGLAFAEGETAITEALAGITTGQWLCEERIVGRELTVGVLAGRSMAVVEIRPDSGRFDYTSKYTKGLTRYLCPAPISEAETTAAQKLAEVAFAACGCRDFARLDFMLRADGTVVLLEINTLPGLKETSLLPMSAGAIGLNFDALVDAMLRPAITRFQSKLS
jgi:D-alanine-D-alanine ligase